MKSRLKEGNRFRLLENGEEFFPAVFQAIEQARHEVIIETFILFADKVGLALHACLLAAARRGVQVDVTVDGYGSPDLTQEFVESLTEAGVRFHVFDPRPLLFNRWRTNIFRRMHRKIVVVDGEKAFVGGINYSADHLADFGPEAKQDYAVEIEGPIVDDIHQFARSNIEPAVGRRWWHPLLPNWRRRKAGRAGNADAMFIVRDNGDHPDDIERSYRLTLRAARREVIIANAYFFPNYRLFREMRRAAERGVQVSLILQGQPDMPLVKVFARMLYDDLARSGVRIYEYCERPLHGKVAVADDEWSTVGSSNLDPLSLALNLEANVVIRDRAFTQDLRGRLQRMMDHHCKLIDPKRDMKRSGWRMALSYVAFHVLRLYPRLAGWFPAHQPKLVPAREFALQGEVLPATVQAGGDTGPPEPWRWQGADRLTERAPDYSLS